MKTLSAIGMIAGLILAGSSGTIETMLITAPLGLCLFAVSVWNLRRIS